GRLRIVRHAVNHNATGSQLRGNAARALKVGADNGGMKTIFRVVSDSDRIVLRVVCDDTEHGAENLFLRDCHVVLHVDEHRGFHEVARFETFWMTLATNQHPGPFLNTLFLSQLRLQSADFSQNQVAKLFTMRPKHLYYQTDTDRVSVWNCGISDIS